MFEALKGGAVDARPIFVGGTGRSGTTVMGKLLGAHPGVVAIDFELRLHADNHGVFHLLDGRTTRKEFDKRVTSKWYLREGNEQQVRRGLHRLVSPDELDAALRRFHAMRRIAPKRAARHLVETLIAPAVQDASVWVESTPYTMRGAAPLLEVWPDARIIHMLRDGRDVAASVAGRPWGPPSPLEGLDWWAHRLRLADSGARSIGRRCLRVDLEHLTIGDREGTYQKVLAHTDLEPGDEALDFVRRKLGRDRAHVGGWRKRVAEADHDLFSRRYLELRAELHAEGVELPLPPAEVDMLAEALTEP